MLHLFGAQASFYSNLFACRCSDVAETLAIVAQPEASLCSVRFDFDDKFASLVTPHAHIKALYYSVAAEEIVSSEIIYSAVAFCARKRS
jgi:hypothetical protein